MHTFIAQLPIERSKYKQKTSSSQIKNWQQSHQIDILRDGKVKTIEHDKTLTSLISSFQAWSLDFWLCSFEIKQRWQSKEQTASAEYINDLNYCSKSFLKVENFYRNLSITCFIHSHLIRFGSSFSPIFVVCHPYIIRYGKKSKQSIKMTDHYNKKSWFMSNFVPNRQKKRVSVFQLNLHFKWFGWKVFDSKFHRDWTKEYIFKANLTYEFTDPSPSRITNGTTKRTYAVKLAL